MQLTGPAGSGKTFLLRTLRTRAEHLPHAYVDVKNRPAASPVEIMVELANQLAIGHWRLGRIRFPRFWLGLLVAEQVSEPKTGDEQRREVRSLLQQIRPLRPIPQPIKDIVVRLATLSGITDESGANTAVDAIETSLRSWRGPAHQWWGRRSRQSATDALLRFRVAFSSGIPIDRREAEEVLCQALLADVRAAYANRLRGPDRTVAATCLVDNVHVGGGLAFVELLARVRSEADAVPDPLFVVAAGSFPAARPVVSPDDVQLAAWSAAHDPEDWRTWFLSVGLRDLDHDEVDRLTRTRGLRSRGSLATFTHRLTGGHPGGVRTVLDLVEHGDAALPGLMLDTGPLEDLLAGIPDEHRQNLITCAAARHVNPPVMLAALGHSPHLGMPDDAASDHAVNAARALLESLGKLMWLRGHGPEAELHPWLRRLLLTTLAARADDDPNSWNVVHRRLRDHYDADGDRLSGWYHRLAVDDVEPAVRALDADPRLLDDPARWTADLLAAVAAPSRHSAVDPGDRIRELTGWAATEPRRIRTLADLIATHLVAADPLSDPFGGLARAIPGRWEVMSREVPAASAVFFSLAQELRDKQLPSDGVVEGIMSWRTASGTRGGDQEPQRITAPISTRRKVLRVVGILAAAGGVSAVGVPLLTQRARCAEGVERMGPLDECVGVSDRYAFSQELVPVMNLISGENDWAGPYEKTTTIGVALPMPSGHDSLMTTDQVLHELEGAFIAQYTANHHDTGTPRIRLEIANVGHDASLWASVIDRLVTIHGLHVVAGLGPSVADTKDAVHELSKRGIATISSIMTADELNGGADGVAAYARVAPTNRDQVSAALRAGLLTERTVLVRDTRTDDLYTKTLGDQFLALRPDALDERYDSSSNGVANRLTDIAAELCVSSHDQVYFAGRNEHLLRFVNALADGGFCRPRTITVVTGDDATVMTVDRHNPAHMRFSDALKRGQVKVLCTALAHPDQWTGAGLSSGLTFEKFEQEYGSRFDTGKLDDGQAMMAHDAVMTAIKAVRRGGRAMNMWSGIHGIHAADGVTGKIDLDGQGNPMRKAVPLLLIRPDGSKTFDRLLRAD